MKSAITTLAFLLSAACTPPVPLPSHVGPRDYRAVTELTLAENDATRARAWSANLRWIGPASTDWEITSSSARSQFADRRANGAFVRHVLDSASRTEIVGPAPHGPPEGFGLKPPRFALRWTETPGAGELWIGAPEVGPRDGGFYGLVDGAVLILNGGTLTLLQTLSNAATDPIEALRQRRWATVSADEFDELELFASGKSVLYAQRQGTDWLDRRGRPSPAGINAFLDGVTQAEVASFVDDPQAVSAATKSAPYDELRLTDRHGAVTFFRVSPKGIGWTSTRAGAAFVLAPSTLELFRSVAKR